MKTIHKFLDWQPFDTWVYECIVRLTMETFLLILCAYPTITTNASRNVAIVAGIIRLIQVEIVRKKASILGRALEEGKIPERPKLAEHKEHELYVLGWLDDLSTYFLVTLAPIVLAVVGEGRIDIVLGLSVFATIVRTIYDRAAYPAWRASRVAWKAKRAKMEGAK